MTDIEDEAWLQYDEWLEELSEYYDHLDAYELAMMYGEDDDG